jgi:cell division protein FtsW (lipid II flippase)
MKQELKEGILWYILEKILRLFSKYANKTFYRFVFSFIAVIAGVLFLILVLGAGSEV